ncbi:MAG: hypothetical protein D6B27_02820 [Gammaproteobacteria bacterium]|nr:MAG: hypothetical protein D6B27_02820 [Gammaproteobacteria bacterium]
MAVIFKKSAVCSMRILFVATLLSCLFLSYLAFADSSNDKKLKKIRQRIEVVVKSLEKKEGKKNKVVNDLRSIERKIGKVSRNLSELSEQLKAKKQEILQLRLKKKQEIKMLDKHKDALSNQIISAYIMGRQSYIKMMLNQKDPAMVARINVYYDYLNKDRAKKIKEVVTILNGIDEIELQLQSNISEVEKIKQKRENDIAELNFVKKDRKNILDKISKILQAERSSLKSLRLDEKKLINLINELRDVLSDIPDNLEKKISFKSLKGKLSLPVDGGIIGRFNQSGESIWQGVFIKAKEGVVVKSISHGRVIYSDWFKGLGLLLIIDHGDGYMTLYGHNQSLYRDVGEWVEAGEKIAVVGVSGGNSKSGLYFEIRKNGKPQNPIKWCSKK